MKTEYEVWRDELAGTNKTPVKDIIMWGLIGTAAAIGFIILLLT